MVCTAVKYGHFLLLKIEQILGSNGTSLFNVAIMQPRLRKLLLIFASLENPSKAEMVLVVQCVVEMKVLVLRDKQQLLHCPPLPPKSPDY